MEGEEEPERDAQGELVRLDYDLDTQQGERAVKVRSPCRAGCPAHHTENESN
jgi:hypothetical protein